MEVKGNTCEDPNLGAPDFQNAELSQTRHQIQEKVEMLGKDDATTGKT